MGGMGSDLRQSRIVALLEKPGEDVEVIGACYYKLNRERHSEEASIDVLCVSPLHRRSGVGRLLLGMAVEHIAGHAAAEDYTPWVSLRVLNQHAVADYNLIDFYQKCGFVEAEDVSEEPWYKRRDPEKPVTARVFHLTDIPRRAGGYLKVLFPGRVVKKTGLQEGELPPRPLGFKPKPPPAAVESKKKRRVRKSTRTARVARG